MQVRILVRQPLPFDLGPDHEGVHGSPYPLLFTPRPPSSLATPSTLVAPVEAAGAVGRPSNAAVEGGGVGVDSTICWMSEAPITAIKSSSYNSSGQVLISF